MTTKNVTNYLLLKAPESAVKTLQKKSEDILSVFTKTVEELKSVNSSVDKEVSDREVQKAKIENELAELSKTKQKNEAVIYKINKFFE